PLDEKTGLPQPERGIRARGGEVVDLPPGHYLMVAVHQGAGGEGLRFHEVFRLIPRDGGAVPGPYRHNRWRFRDGVVHLDEIVLPPADIARGMGLFPEAEQFEMAPDVLQVGKDGRLVPAPKHRCRVRAFYLDRTEVTDAAYIRWLRVAPPGRVP